MRNGHATAQGFNLTCEQNCSVAASVPPARQCWALKPPRDAACPWVSHMQGYTSKIPVQGLRRLCNDSAHVLPVNNICCCKRHSGLMPPCFVLWSCQMLPASQRHSQMCLVWRPKRVFPSIWVFSAVVNVGAFSWSHLNTGKGWTACQQGDKEVMFPLKLKFKITLLVIP